MENFVCVVRKIFWYALYFIIRLGRQRGEMVREVKSVKKLWVKTNKRVLPATPHHVATTVS